MMNLPEMTAAAVTVLVSCAIAGTSPQSASALGQSETEPGGSFNGVKSSAPSRLYDGEDVPGPGGSFRWKPAAIGATLYDSRQPSPEPGGAFDPRSGSRSGGNR